MEDTVYKWLVKSWIIKKRDVKDLGIDPNKDYEQLTLIELILLSDFLDIRVSDLVDY